MWAMGLAALIGGAVLFGCSNTAEGMKEDTQDNAQKAAEATEKTGEAAAQGLQNAGSATADAAKDTSAALVLTPKVKNAIIADPQLNEPGNLINVESKDNVVHLVGYVKTEALKKRAGNIAEGVLRAGNSTDKLSNELEVKAG